MRCLGQQIMTSGAGLKWKVIRMWDYPMIKHNSNILRVPTDFENIGWKEISTLREIFLTSCLEKVGSVIRMLGRMGQ